MGGPERSDDDAAMRARLKTLSTSIDSHRKGSIGSPETRAPSGPEGVGQAMNTGFRVMSELVAAVVVSALIGWSIDHWLGSSPVALIVFVALGTAAGFWNVYRIAARPTTPGR